MITRVFTRLAACALLAAPAAFVNRAIAQTAQPPIMFDARVVGDVHRVRFVADLSAGVTPAVFTLADPYRIVVDLPQIEFALPENAGAAGRGLITAFRYGLISKGKSRIVIDVMQPVLIDKAFVVDATNGQPFRLVIDAVPATRAQFEDASAVYREQRKAAAAADAARVPAGASNGSDRPLIVLDPGHGGIDAGAKGAMGAVEKDVVLAFSQVLSEELAERGRYRVLRTRKEDEFVGLRDRVDIAREAHADLFVSIHANSFRGRRVRGAIIYTASEEASGKMAAELADSENRSDILAGADVEPDERDEVTDILLDLIRRETRNYSVLLARRLVEELSGTVEMFKIPHQQAGFKVLEAPDVPSALIELGYLTNATDEGLLVSPEWQGSAATAIADALEAFFDARKAGEGIR
ncbi:MAG: N-acetylmuramoyl-L-alanine amidase [Alphaproteobacteria bacterium]